MNSLRLAFASSLRRLVFAACAGLLLPACVIQLDTLDHFEDGGSGGKSNNSGTNGTSAGAGGSLGVGTGAGTGGGGGSLPQGTMPADFSALCGGPGAECVPGTNDCTPGGDPGMGTGGMAPSMIGCQLSDDNGTVVASCKDVGTFGEGSPCLSAADCAAGLGCVATPSGGICRPYCCGDVEACPSSTFCAPAQMAGSTLEIPVCVPAKDCKLLDDSTCPNGQTCTLVRVDGTTSCVNPGVGGLNEACPCAPGFICAKSNQCAKLCHIGNDAVDCLGGTCQGGVMGFPNGIGVCVNIP